MMLRQIRRILKKVLCTYLQLYFWKKVQEESSQKKLPKMTFQKMMITYKSILYF